MRRLSRRAVLIGGGATAGVLAAGGCHYIGSGGLTPPISGSFTLTTQYADHVFNGKTFRTRTYNGTIPGPTLTVVPGQQLAINIVNAFPPNPPAATPGPGIDPMNNPHLFNTTNLHVHGLQVVPHIFDPVGTTNPSAMMVAIQPGTSFQYNFSVPADQPTGLYWYHPHHHGSTDVEVEGGMAGLILVKGAIDQVPEIAAARDVQLAFQTLNANKESSGIYDLEYNAYQTPAHGGYKPRADYMAGLVNGQLVSFIDFTVPPTCGASNCGAPTSFAPPQLQMQPGEVVRLRLLNGSNTLNLPLQLPGFKVYVIGHDGVNLLAPQLVDTISNPILLTMGARVELLVVAPITSGSYTLGAQAVTGVVPSPPHPWPPFNLLQITVAGGPVSMNIPTTLPTPTREYPLIADSEITGRRTVVFNNLFPAPSILFGTEMLVNNVPYDEMSVLFTLPVGQAEEWTISTPMPEGHPFHLHTNSFEVRSVTDPINGTVNFSPPIICDSFWVPANGQIVMRVRYKEWRGKDVFHCHKLVHEDQGMMANTLLI